MSNNYLTPEEKQMPVIRLPLRIAVFAWADLFAALLMCAVLWVQDNPAGIFAVGFVLGIPAVVGLFVYRNHMIRFDKDNIVYRNYIGKITRFRYEDITEIVETDSKTFLAVDDLRIPINKNDRSGKWLLELAEKKAVRKNNQKKFGDDLYEAKLSPMMAAIFIICGIFFLGVELLGLSGDSMGKYFVLYPMIFICFFMLIPFFREKHYYNEEKIIYISAFTGKKKEYLFEELLRVESNYNMLTLHFPNGKYRVSGMSEASESHFFSILDHVFESKIETIRAEQGDKAAEEAELNLFARNRGKSIIKRVYGTNILSDNGIWLMYTAITICLFILLIPENDYQPGIGEWKFVIISTIVLTSLFAAFIAVCRNMHRLPNALLDIMLMITEPSLECYERMNEEKQDRYRYVFFEISEEEESLRKEKALAKGMTEEEYEKEDLHILDRVMHACGRIFFRGNVLNFYSFLMLFGATIVITVLAWCAVNTTGTLDENDLFEAKTTVTYIDDSPGIWVDFYDTDGTEYSARYLRKYCSDYEKLLNEAENGTVLHFYGAKRDYGMLIHAISDEHGNVYYTEEDAQKAADKAARSEVFGGLFILAAPFFILATLLYFLWLRYPNIAPKSFLRHVIQWCYITETFVERIPEALREEARAELKKQEERDKNPPQEETEE